MLVYAGSAPIDNIIFNDNTSRNSSRLPAGVWGDGGMGTVRFNNTTIINAPGKDYKFASGTVYWNGEQKFPNLVSVN